MPAPACRRSVLAGLALLAAALPSTAAAAPPSRPFVVGGQAAPDGSWPYAAFVLARAADGRLFACTGSLIAPAAVVTAAHCALDPSTDRAYRPSQMRVVVGVHDLRAAAGGGVIVPSAVAADPLYNRTTLADDAAVLTLPQTLDVPPVRLATPAEIAALPPASPVSLAGWGQVADFQADLQPTLQQAQVQLQPAGYCTQALKGFDPATMLCTDVPHHGVGPCHGDSGGPLVAQTANGEALIGLVDWGGFVCDESAAAYASMGAVGYWVAETAGIAPPDGSQPAEAPLPPRNLRRPFISGQAGPGGHLKCHEGRWTNAPASYEYTWIYNGREVPDLHSREVDLGPGISTGWAHCMVRALNGGGRGSATSRGVHIRPR